MLELRDVRAGYGSAEVLHGVSIDVEQGEVAVILGANGVGKTTMLRCVAGLLRPWSGKITFNEHLVDRMSAEKIVRIGLGMVPGPPGIFRDMSVIDSLRVGAFALAKGRNPDARLELILQTFPILNQRRTQMAGSLSGGEQRMLAIARPLMSEPTLLLVDEPSMGLSPAMVSNVLRLLDEIRRDGVTILMAEQNVGALDIADRAYVIEKGTVAREDRGAALQQTRADLARAYLGGRAPAEVRS
ncbi:MAG: ABC transporter ATP-binding protein [Actinomycetota bacterium]